MSASDEADLRDLRHQFTVFLMTGGLALALLEGSRRMNAHSSMAEWLRGSAIAVLLIGCTLAGVSMLVVGIVELRRAAAHSPAAGVARPHGRVSRPRALLSVVLGAVLGLLVPGSLVVHLLSDAGS